MITFFENKHSNIVKKLADKVDEILFDKYGIVTSEDYLDIANAINPFYRFWDNGYKTIGYAEYDDKTLSIYCDIDRNDEPVITISLSSLSKNLNRFAIKVTNVVTSFYDLKNTNW